MSILRTSIVFVAVAAAAAAPGRAQRDTACHERQPTGSEIRMASEEEPGEPLVITGRVLSGPEKTPMPGTRVLASHTDSQGYYSEGGMDEQKARLCGVLSTDAEGRFRIDTIVPAHYATGGPPAHVHFELTIPGERMRRLTLNFEGDPKLQGRSAGETWDTIRPLVEKDGVYYVERDLWVR